MAKYTLGRKVYGDWFREPLSPLEKTWRFPILFYELQKKLREKLFLKVPDDYYTFENDYLFIRTDWIRLLLQSGLLLAVVRITLEVSSAKKYWQENIFPKHQTLLEFWGKENLTNKNNKELWEFANKTVKEDTSSSMWTVYIGIYAFAFEILLGWFYRFFVKDNPKAYQKLLIGFPNKTTELNIALFKLGQLKRAGNEKKYKQDFKKFLKDYGFRTSDWELALPTFRENEALLIHLLKLYSNNPDLNPAKKIQEAKREREEKAKFAIHNLRLKLLTKPIFNWILKWAWEYVPLRETRQHYSGSSTYFIRRSLNLIGKRFGLAENLIFYLEKEEVEKLLSGDLKIRKAKSLAEERSKLREKQKLNLPNHE